MFARVRYLHPFAPILLWSSIRKDLQRSRKIRLFHFALGKKIIPLDVSVPYPFLMVSYACSAFEYGQSTDCT
jgi:hypothetical protein